MSAAPEGIAYFSKQGLKTSVFDPDKVEHFYSYILLDIALNGTASNARLEWAHPRDNDKGQKRPFRTICVMYGRNPNSIDRIRKIYQDESKAGNALEAGFLPVPMPTGSERFFWLDLTYGIRGVYFPICHAAPGPYRELCKYVRLDFKHRNIQLPFARPFHSEHYPGWSQETLSDAIEKARLDLSPENTVEDGKLHYLLRDIPRFTQSILGEKEGSKKKIFQNQSTDKAKAETKNAKAFMKTWLEESKSAVMTDVQKEQVQKFDASAKKFGIVRTHKHFSKHMQPTVSNVTVDGYEDPVKKQLADIFKIVYPQLNLKSLIPQKPHGAQFIEAEHLGKNWNRPEIVELGRVKYGQDIERDLINSKVLLTTLMSSPDLDPDAISFGHVDFQTDSMLGLGFHPEVTLRFDVKELIVLLAIPESLRRAEITNPQDAEKEKGDIAEEKNSLGDKSAASQDDDESDDEGPPLDVYKQLLVLAWGSEEIKAVELKSGMKAYEEQHMSKDTVINYTAYIRGDFGLKMEYVPNPKPLWRQFAEFFTQILSVLADLIPGVGPFIGFAIYFVSYAVMDNSWVSGFENCAPPIFALMYSQKATLGKWTLKAANKTNRMRGLR